MKGDLSEDPKDAEGATKPAHATTRRDFLRTSAAGAVPRKPREGSR
jgi:hypothetical protein